MNSGVITAKEILNENFDATTVNKIVNEIKEINKKTKSNKEYKNYIQSILTNCSDSIPTNNEVSVTYCIFIGQR